MKQIYIALVFLVFQFGFANVLAPSATILGSTTVCQNSPAPIITFTGSGGLVPYTFTYTITGVPGTQTIQTTGTNSSVTLPASTGIAGTFIYTLVSVHDSTLPVTEQPVTGQTAVVNVNPQPNANLGGTGSGSIFGGFPAFRICSNIASPFTFTNTSTTSATNSNYTIDWGDSSPNFTAPSWTTLTHTYQIGLYYLNYTINSSNGCSITRMFVVFVGSNPAVSLGNPGNTDICNTDSLTFPITGTTNNPPGTTYTVTFNDGSTPQVFNHPPPASVTHTFTSSSCGTTSSDGSNTYPNSFSANIVATNPCSTSSVGVVPIYVSANPQAQFTGPAVKCVNTQACFTNTSIGNQVISNTCLSPSIVWTISPSTGYTIASGSLGNDFSSTDSSLWLSGSDNLCINFSVAGTYTITIKTGNKCGVDTESKTICIEPPLIPLFTLNTIAGCTPVTVTATNNTALTNQCAAPTYLWQVTHTPLYCATTTVSIPNQATANATYNFTEPGTYAIKLTVTNSCGSFSTTQTVTVKKPPTVSLAPISNTCGSASITPNATVTNCAPTGGTLTYAWSFPGGTPSSSTAVNPGVITYPAGGPYTVSLVATNECGPSATATQVFSVNTAPVITNTSLSQTICSGSSTTLVNLMANPSGTTFTWNASATSGVTGFLTSGTNTIPAQTISTSNSSPGTVTYIITPTIGACSGTPVNYVVTVNPAPAINTQPASSTVCLGGTPTALTVALNSASVTPTYQWYSNTSPSTTGGTLISGATSATYNPPSTTVGTFYYYCVISLSSGGCSGLTSAVATVTINALPTISTQPMATQNLCVGITIPSALSVAYTGGTGAATYQWYSNTSPTTSGGTPISGANGASYTPPVFATAGSYYYYVTINLAGNGCGSITSTVAEIVIYNDPTITTQPLSTQTLCQSATPTTLQVAATGGNGSFLYQWYSNVNNNTTSGNPISGATNATYAPATTTVGTTYYYCIISQPTLGCSVTSTVGAIIVNASPNITTQPLSSSVCSGGTPTTLSFSYSNGTGTPTYQWYSNTLNNTINGILIAGETNATYTPPTTIAGVLYYYCLITFPNLAGSCSTIATATAAITVTPAATVNQQPLSNQSLCAGGTILSALAVSYSNGTGTASYQWYSNTISSTTGGTAVGSNNANYTPPVFTTPGTYYYYVVISFSGSGCGNITSSLAQVDVIADPTITIQPLPTQTLCQNAGAVPLTVAATGGIGSTFNYQWYSSPANSSTGGTPIAGETNNNFTPPTVPAGTFYYYCIVTQPGGIGCDVTSAVATVIINIAPVVTTQPTAHNVCVGDTSTVLSFAYANGVGTPTYQWYSNTTNSNTGGTPISGAVGATYIPPTAIAGTIYYYCVISFPALSGGCAIITTDVVGIIVNDIPVISNQSTTICSTNAFSVSPLSTGGDIVPSNTTYLWTMPVITPSGSVTGASAETVGQSTISQTLINTTTSPATVIYTVTPTAPLGNCVGNTFSVTVTVNPAINPNVVLTNNACFGVDIASINTNVTGGIPFSSGTPYHYTWSGPSGFSSNLSGITNLEPGNYNLTIDDAGNCPFTDSYTIIEPADIVIAVDSENDISCYAANNGSITITVTGGTGNYAYTWTKNTNPFANTEDISNLSPGNYQVSVTDVNNCGPRIMSFTITEPPLLVVNLVSQTNVLCYGAATGAITVNVAGGTPGSGYSFSWTGPNSFTSNNQNLNGIAAGTYDLTVTDANGCIKTLTVIITQSTEIIIAYTTTPITCYGANNASLSVVLSGGNPPYTFQWNNLSTSLTQTNLSAGNYIITVTDNVGCIKTETIVIPDAPIFTVNPIVSQITCHGANNGSINLNLTGGIAPLVLTWGDGSTAGLIRNNLGPGTYTATISDGTPCYIVRTFTIIEPQSLVLSASLTHAFDCNLTNTGAIDLAVAGGTPPYSYSWSTGAVIEDLSNLTSGTYAAIVTDANGCVATANYIIIRQDPITIAVAMQTNFDCAAHTVNQDFVAQVSGGFPPYQLQWSSGIISGANNEIMHSNVNGTVLLTVTDSHNCVATHTVTVDTPVLGYPSFDTTSYGFTTYGLYAIGDPIQFNSTITGDYVSVSWDFGDGTFSTELNPVHTYIIPKDYIVTQTVTYPFGCVYVQTITLIVEKGYVLVVPTAYTPNNDGLNDTYRPVTKGLKNVVLDVYDTWGSLIYSETGDVLVGWDGKIKGFNAENGNYYSKVRAETFYGTVVNANQTFVLIK